MDEKQLLQQIVDLFIQGGYFRARIASLSPFDTLTGGLAWCIAASNVDADIDLLYDDGAILGEKIKVGEAIEAALQKMKCPHALQAHQIQGLDYPAVLPVVKWLVKKVLATRQEFGTQLRSYAHYQFSQSYSFPEDDEPMGSHNARASQDKLLERYVPQRRYRPARGAARPAEIIHRAQAALLEYGHLPLRRVADQAALRESSSSQPSTLPGGEPSLAGGFSSWAANDGALPPLPEFVASSLEPVPARSSGSASMSATGIPLVEMSGATPQYSQFSESSGISSAAASQSLVEALQRQLEAQRVRHAEARRAHEAALEEVQTNQELLTQQEELQRRHLARIHKLEGDVSLAGASDVLPGVITLLQQTEGLRKKEAQLRGDCRAQRARLQAEIEELRSQLERASSAADVERKAEVAAAFQAEVHKWQAQRAATAKTNRETALLQRRLADQPSRSELLQYERRFVELYEHVQKKHGETRRHYATHNALADAHKFTLKEQSLLDSIHSQFEAAMASSAGRAKLLESMEGLAAGVRQTVAKADAKLKAEQRHCEQLREKQAAAVASQRAYFAALKEFQEECARGEKLLTFWQQQLNVQSSRGVHQV